MKGLLAFGICLLAAASALAQNPAPGPPGAAPQYPGRVPPPGIHPAVVRIVAPGNGSISYGSGTLVYSSDAYALVVTNWHVINEATGPISVHFPDGFYSLGSVQRIDRDWDLAAIAIRKPNAQPVRLAAAPARPGEVLTIAGYGSGSYRAASGPCTQYVAPGTTFPFEMVEVAVKARQGDSGGPIFNSRGELAGVLFGEGQGRTSGSYCGRVRWFLANMMPTTPASSTMIAGTPLKPVPPRQPMEQTHPDGAGVSLAQTPVIQTSGGGNSIREVAPAAAEKSPPAVVASTRSADAAIEAPQYIGWEDVAGHTAGAQIKTVLAAVGVLSIILRTLGWLGRERAKA